MLLKGGAGPSNNKKKAGNSYVCYPQSGPKLAPLPYYKRMSDFEDKLDTIDLYEHSNVTNIVIREVLQRKLVIAVFESKEPGQIKGSKKTYIL